MTDIKERLRDHTHKVNMSLRLEVIKHIETQEAEIERLKDSINDLALLMHDENFDRIEGIKLAYIAIRGEKT